VVNIQGQELPFTLEIKNDSLGDQVATIINGEERIEAGVMTRSGDSVVIPLHIFDTKISVKPSGQTLKGYWIKNYVSDYSIPFTAWQGISYRFSEKPGPPADNISGKWDAVFANESDTTLAVGVFEQQGNRLQGTFLLTSGDYRYLDGEVDGDSLRLSTFDGEHAYLFKAMIHNDTAMTGMYWSGKTWNQPWTARKNERARLPDVDSLTFLKPGYTSIDFTFRGLDGRPVSSNDEKYQGKVLILQILGTWCPNCMDETLFLADWYRKNKDKGVEIIGLAFERKDDLEYAGSRLRMMKQRLGADYDFLIAGKSGAGQAAKALPMLQGSIFFPTTIFIDREGKVRKIHLGFSGPGTGPYYDRFVGEFNAFMQTLLAE
jgi:peroxiredoxin